MNGGNTKIYIYGIAALKDDDILNEFWWFGRIQTFSSYGGYAFIEYEEADSAAQAVEETNGQIIFANGFRLEVTHCRNDGSARNKHTYSDRKGITYRQRGSRSNSIY